MHVTMTNEGLLRGVACRLAEPVPALVVAGRALLGLVDDGGLSWTLGAGRRVHVSVDGVTTLKLLLSPEAAVRQVTLATADWVLTVDAEGCAVLDVGEDSVDLAIWGCLDVSPAARLGRAATGGCLPSFSTGADLETALTVHALGGDAVPPGVLAHRGLFDDLVDAALHARTLTWA